MIGSGYRRSVNGRAMGRASRRGWLLAAALIAVLLAAATGLLWTASAEAVAGVSYSEEELAFVELLNDYRASRGLDPLVISDTISQACDRHNSDMAKYGFFDHYTAASDWFAAGSTPAERMIECGYAFNTVMGENLAGGCDTAEAALEGFKNSVSHKAIILTADLKVIGVSFVYVAGSEWGYYWTTEFGGYVDSSADVIASSEPAPASITAAPVAWRTDGGFWKRLLIDLRT